MAKFKAGLHKQISSIFDGVPLSAINKEMSVEAPPNQVQQQQQKQQPQQPQQPAKPSLPAFVREQDSGPSTRPPVVQPPSPQVAKPVTKPVQPVPSAPRPPMPRPVKADTATKPFVQDAFDQARQKLAGKLFAGKSSANMQRQKIAIIAIPVLFVILIILLTQVLKTPVSATKLANSGSGQSAKIVAAQAAGAVNWKIPEVYPTAMPDPMQKNRGVVPINHGGDSSQIRVTGILWTEDRPAAVIDGQIVHEGDNVRGTTIIKIEKDGVDFAMDGKTWTQKIEK